MKIPREEQFTSAVVIGELYKGAYRSRDQHRHLTNIEQRILPDADIQIASTALGNDLELVTGNLRHFRRISGLKLNSIIAASQNRD